MPMPATPITATVAHTRCLMPACMVIAYALSRKDALHDEPDVGRSLCKTPHVPWEPVVAVGNEDAQRPPCPRDSPLQRPLNAVQHRVLVVRGRNRTVTGERTESIDEMLVVRGDLQERPSLPRAGGQHPARELVEVLVDIALFPKGDGSRLQICPLDDADRGTQRQERLKVRFCAVEIRLQSDADSGGSRAGTPEQIQRPIGVRGALHVEPDEVVALSCSIDEQLEVS